MIVHSDLLWLTVLFYHFLSHLKLHDWKESPRNFSSHELLSHLLINRLNKSFKKCKYSKTHFFIKAMQIHASTGLKNTYRTRWLNAQTFRPLKHKRQRTIKQPPLTSTKLNQRRTEFAVSIEAPLSTKSSASYWESDSASEKAQCWQRGWRWQTPRAADWLMSHICSSHWGCRHSRFEKWPGSLSSGSGASWGLCAETQGD